MLILPDFKKRVSITDAPLKIHDIRHDCLPVNYSYNKYYQIQFGITKSKFAHDLFSMQNLLVPDRIDANGKDRTIKSVHRALQIIRIVRDEHKGATIKQMADSLRITPASALQLARTLEEEGFLRQDADTRRFYMGIELAHLAIAFRAEIGLVLSVAPAMYKLHLLFGENTRLTAWRDGEPRGLFALTGSQHMLVNPEREAAPMHHSMHATGAGKMILAGMPDSEVHVLLAKHGLPPYTPRTITTEHDLFAELEKVRLQDYAIAEGELYPNQCALAAPVRDYTGHTVAVISIGSLIDRCQGELRTSMIRELCNAARSVSFNLGFTVYKT
jgi:DNA-binding IclR family transcriptional regulator